VSLRHYGDVIWPVPPRPLVPASQNTRAVAAAPVRHYLTSLSALSESLRGARADHGDHPALLGRADIESFVHRLAFLAGQERISADARIRICREIRHLLRQFRALGLTRAGGPAAGLPEDFAVRDNDIPLKPDEPEAGRDLPPEIMRQLCGHLPALEDVSCRETRVAAELIIDTGRRPDEICALPWDCLEYDEPRHEPVLVYFNHKSARQGRRLPVAQATAELIIDQKARVRETFPGTALSELKLLPAAYANPHGRRPGAEGHFGARHRDWIASLPPLLRADGTEFDKARIIPYAYGHTYAQRHADAGVPVDVLATLMDHLRLDTTRGYYNPRTAVAAPSTRSPRCRSNGTATASGGKPRRCWTPSTPAARSARSRFRSAPAPSRPTCRPAGMPAPTGSAAPAAATSAPTSPTCPTCTPTSTTCSATANACSPRPTSTSGHAPKPSRPRRKSPGSGSSSPGSRTGSIT
jgi:integrase